MGVSKVCVLLFHDLDLPTIYKFIYYQAEADSTHLDPSRKGLLYPISHDRVSFLSLIDMKSKANREMEEKVIGSLLNHQMSFLFFTLLRPFKTL